jgi:RNA polymerase sigma factor (sigma-70 family)
MAWDPQESSRLRSLHVSDLVQDMLKSAARYPLLTPLQELELGRAIRAWQDHPDGPDGAPERIRKAGKRALDRFVVCNIRLAHHVARRYSDRGVPLEDLMQASLIGMMEAYRKFKPELGYRSSSYAIWYARQSCQQILAQMGQTLRLPVHTCDAIGRVARCRRVFIEEHGRAPSQAELSAACGMSEKQLAQLNDLVARSRMVSIDAQVRGSDGAAMAPASGGDLPLCAIDGLHQSDMAQHLRQVLESHEGLCGQQRFILRQLYLEQEPPNVVRLAYLLHMSRASVIDLKQRALDALKERMAPNEGEAVAA